MNDADRESSGRRRSILKGIGLSTGGLVVLTLCGLVAWGVIIEPRFLLDVRTETAEVRNLPPSWEGETLVLMADLQVGMWLDNDGMVRKAVRKAIELGPAAVLIAGDFIYGESPDRIERAVELVRPLAEAGIPTYAVFGNHDYSLMFRDSELDEGAAGELAARLEDVGIEVLENEARPMPSRRGGAPLHVVGIGSEWAGRSRSRDALAQLPDAEPRVVLMHNPLGFRDLPAYAGSLTLSAHTHGGQLRIPFTRSTSWLDITKEREVLADGWGEQGVGATGNRIYVNRGIGFSSIPARFRCRPELTVFRLERAVGDVPAHGPEGDSGDDPGTPDEGDGEP
ncbi:metallophosphoesterase [Halomonas denitrificans]|nr:metallophosphoesterase [Halomonas denitrificans]